MEGPEGAVGARVKQVCAGAMGTRRPHIWHGTLAYLNSQGYSRDEVDSE